MNGWTDERTRRFHGRTARGKRLYEGDYFARVFQSLARQDSTPWCSVVALSLTTTFEDGSFDSRFRVVIRIREHDSEEQATEHAERELRRAIAEQLTADANEEVSR